MIRIVSLITLAFLLLHSLPAQAGIATINDGKGSWQSTRCSPPQSPSGLPKDPETAANELNAQMSAHDQYVAALEAYMKCISQEAEADANAASDLIVQSAQEIINKTHAQISEKSSAAK